MRTAAVKLTEAARVKKSKKLTGAVADTAALRSRSQKNNRKEEIHRRQKRRYHVPRAAVHRSGDKLIRGRKYVALKIQRAQEQAEKGHDHTKNRENRRTPVGRG